MIDHLLVRPLLLFALIFMPSLAFADHVAGPLTLQVIHVLDVPLTRIKTRAELDQHLIAQPSENQNVTLIVKIISNVTDGSLGKVLGPDDLVIRHEKKFHFFGFDEGLTNFIHEHPVFLKDVYHREEDSGLWAVQVRFRRAGNYHLWADVALNRKPPMDKTLTEFERSMMENLPGYECVGTAPIQVMGASVPSSRPHTLATRLTGRDGNSILSLGADMMGDNGMARAGELLMFDLNFSRKDGSRPRITNYLGARAHFVITSLDGSKIFHAHPMLMGPKGQEMWMLHTKLPEGQYRIFAQFLDAGIRKTVELSLRVSR